MSPKDCELNRRSIAVSESRESWTGRRRFHLTCRAYNRPKASHPQLQRPFLLICATLMDRMKKALAAPPKGRPFSASCAIATTYSGLLSASIPCQ